MAKKPEPLRKLIAENRRARFDYMIEDTLEAGIQLVGTEVKSLRGGRASLSDAYASEDKGELWLWNMHIPEYGPANRFNHEPKRARKLLLHRRQISRLLGQVQREGYTLIPLAIYFNDRGRAKCELGLARGKKAHDKRQAIKERDWNREKRRLLARD